MIKKITIKRNRRVLASLVMVSLLTLVLVSSMLFIGCGGAAQKDITKVPVYATAFGAGPTTHAMGFEDILKKNHPWFRIEVIETPGGAYNARLLNDVHGKKEAETTIATGGVSNTLSAQLGMLFPNESLMKNSKVLINHTIDSWLFVTFNPNIKTLADIAGKRIAVGQKTQTSWGQFPAALLEHSGIKAEVQYAGPANTLRYLIDGQADVAFTMANVMIKNGQIEKVFHLAQWAELEASGKKLYYVDVPKEAVDKFEKATGVKLSFATVKEGTYKDQNVTFHAAGADGGWGSDDGLREDIAYEFVYNYLKYHKKFVEYQAVGGSYNPETLMFGIPKDMLHPGAIRAAQAYAKEDSEAAEAFKRMGIIN